MNDLIERYVAAVERHLPADKREDIAEELNDAIASRIEERSEQTGRPLTDNELCEVLKAFGNPLVVASRYGPQRALVGPALLPFYYNTLRIVVAIVVVLAALGAFATISHNEGPLASFAHFWSYVWTGTIFTIGIVTIVFAVMERLSANLADSWDPKKLPAVRDERFVPYAASIGEFCGNAGFIALAVSPELRYWIAGAIFNRGADVLLHFPLALTQASITALWIVVATAAMTAVINIVNIFRPTWWQLRAGMQILTSLIAFIVAFVLLEVRSLVVPAPGNTTADIAIAATATNAVMLWIAAGVIVISIVTIALQTYKFFKNKPRRMSGAVATEL